MPSSRVLNFTDPFAYQSAFRSVDAELFPTAKGKFRAELTQVSLSKLWVHGAHEDLPRVYIGMVKPDRAAIGFLTRPNQPAMLHCGMMVSPGEIVINDTDLMYRRTSANCDWGSMSLSKDDLDAIYQAVTGHEYARSSLKHIVKPAPKLMSRLLNIHALVGHLAKTTPDILSLPEVARALEQELILLMTRCLTAGCSSGMTSGGRRHDKIIARFKEYLEAHTGRILYLTEICSAINVANSLSFPAENASCPPRDSAGGSVGDNRHSTSDRSRLLGTGALCGRLSCLIWRVTVGIPATASRRSASIS